MRVHLKRNFIVMALFSGAVAVGCGKTAADGENAEKPTDDGQVEAPAGMTASIKGMPEGDKPVTSETLSLEFQVDGDIAALGLVIDRFECRIGESKEYTPCTGVPFVISGLRDAEQYSIAVRAVIRNPATGDVYTTDETGVTFKVDLSGPQAGSQPTAETTRSLSDRLQVGSAYVVKVPEGMHVTEYSSSKTTGVLSVFRILPDSDPYYLNNFECNHDRDRIVASIAPAGEALMYCHSTPTRKDYKQDSEYRLAHNHIEVATDTNLITADEQERLTVSIFDADYELTTARSRFYSMCQNSNRSFIRVPMLENFFMGRNPEEVDFWYCDTYQPDLNGSPVLWRIGAFVDVDHMDWSCGNCSYQRAVEAVYMVRANGSVFLPAAFARQAQERYMGLVDKLTP